MITADLLKLGEETVMQWLTQVAARIWHSVASARVKDALTECLLSEC